MTVTDVISMVDAMAPNTIAQAYKIMFTVEIENTFRQQLLLSDDMEEQSISAELTIPKPYEDIYPAWVESRVHYYNHDFEKYQNAAAVFEARWNKLRGYIAREIRPAYGGTLEDPV